MARYYASRIRMELHIVVDPGMTVAESHDIVDCVVDMITARFDGVEKVLVHVDPDRSAFAESSGAGKNKFSDNDIDGEKGSAD
jgi:divalent metal cation (Fe/Co/Zn/Cd) transporter